MKNDIFPFGKWICAKRFLAQEPIDLLSKEEEKPKPDLPENLKNIHMLVRKTFKTKPTQNMKMRITADDYYKLYINGKYIGQGPAQGYVFNYYWNEYDISEYLFDGENEIFVDVYYQGLINRAYNSGDRRMGVIAEVYDGVECILYTDKDWEYTVSKGYTITHTIGYDTMFAENFDSRYRPKYISGCPVKENDYTFSGEPTPALQVYAREPVLSEKLANGGIFYDFGCEITATLRIKACGSSGNKIRILCGEETENTALKVKYDSRCNCLCDECWTLSDGENTYSQYEYRGFRYVTLLPDSGVTVYSLEAIVQHYPFDDNYCTLQTENEILRSVWDICKNGVKYGSQEIYVDCPTREKGQYAGDLTVTSASQIILTGDLSLFKKAIDNQIQSAKICKGLMAVTPGSLMQEIADYSLQFPILALRYYKYTADREYLKKCLDTCEGILEHFAKFAREDGLLSSVSDKWNLVDWPKEARDGYDFFTDRPVASGVHNVVNAFYIGCTMQTEEIRDILGIEKEKQSPKLIKSFEKAFFSEKTRLYTDSENGTHSALHSNVLPVFYGFCREESKQQIGEFIVRKGLCCGVYMAYFVLKALCRLERWEDAYSFIVSTDEHSWYNMVREGATTCFEAWGKEQKWNTSLCHPWASAPISVLVEDIIPNKPEVARIIYSPTDGKTLPIAKNERGMRYEKEYY